MTEDEREEKRERLAAQDRCFQEQQFFTLSSVAFSGFFGGLQGRLGTGQTIFSAGVVLTVAIFASLLILQRADYYRQLEGHPTQSIWGQIRTVWAERSRSSSLYYCVLTLFAGIAVAILMFSKIWC